jgi:alkylation response protein AidB-like acyl-CoA dehydrogenase
MNFDFSDDLKMLRDQARKFLRDRNSVVAARRVLESAEPYDKALWRAIAEMGWTGAAIPEEYGGAGLKARCPRKRSTSRPKKKSMYISIANQSNAKPDGG